MNFGKIITVLAGGLAFCASLHAADLAMNNAPGNPYAAIVTRNVFNLNPPVVDTNPPVDPTLPKITPNGIMSIFGHLQVLFKTSKTGAKDEYYTLSEGVGQDDIEVMHIDDKNGVITFKNHGTVQEIPLTVARSTGAPGPSMLPINRGPIPGNRMERFGNRGVPGRFDNWRGGNGNNSGNSGADNSGSPNLRSIPSRTYQPQAPKMSPEESAIIIEEQRARALDQGDPRANLFPPTPLTGKY